jgi:hypothetical protein
MEKRRPTDDLNAVKEALVRSRSLCGPPQPFRTMPHLALAGTAWVAVIASMERRMFVKSMATFDDHRVSEEVALQLNFGHTPQETNRKHYASMSEADRESILDELCRRVLSDRSGLELYLAFERGEIPETHQDYCCAPIIRGPIAIRGYGLRLCSSSEFDHAVQFLLRPSSTLV